MNHASNKSCVATSQPAHGVREIASMIVAAIAGPAVSANIETVGDQRMTTSWTFASKSAPAGWSR
jgi:hypothetical protein